MQQKIPTPFISVARYFSEHCPVHLLSANPFSAVLPCTFLQLINYADVRERRYNPLVKALSMFVGVSRAKNCSNPEELF